MSYKIKINNLKVDIFINISVNQPIKIAYYIPSYESGYFIMQTR